MIPLFLLNWRVLAIVGVIVAALGGTHIKAYQMGADHEVATQAREDKHVAKAVEAATAVSAQAISKIRPKYSTINAEVQREIRTNTIFSECTLPANSLRNVNKALTNGPETTDGGKLPEADKTE
jgi:hypothetical protein